MRQPVPATTVYSGPIALCLLWLGIFPGKTVMGRGPSRPGSQRMYPAQIAWMWSFSGIITKKWAASPGRTGAKKGLHRYREQQAYPQRDHVFFFAPPQGRDAKGPSVICHWEAVNIEFQGGVAYGREEIEKIYRAEGGQLHAPGHLFAIADPINRYMTHAGRESHIQTGPATRLATGRVEANGTGAASFDPGREAARQITVGSSGTTYRSEGLSRIAAARSYVQPART